MDIPSSPEAPVPATIASPTYRDRSTGLLVFGIIEIAGGVLATLAIPLLLLSVVFSHKSSGEGGTPLRPLAVTFMTYAALAVVLVVLGIGATQAKRWARALNLIASWVWLITGVLITVLLVVMLPMGFLAGMKTAGQNQNAGALSTGVMAAILTIVIVFLAIFLIVLPLVFLLFYRSRDVEETCKHRDPVERWTDRRPLPVLALALIASTSAAYYLVLSFTTPLFPFFGRYLTGLPATVVFLVFAAVDAYIAFSFFRLNPAGWWVAVVAMIFRIVSSVLTVGRADLLEAYSKLGWSPQQLEMLRMNPMFRSGTFIWWSVGFMVLYLAFLLWLKRYFRPAAASSYTELGDLPGS